MKNAVWIWLGLAVATAVVAEEQRRGCRQCGAVLPLLQAVRTTVCPACERALQAGNRLLA